MVRILLFMVVLLGNASIAQNYLDSLSVKLSKAKNDSVRLAVYYKFYVKEGALNLTQQDSVFHEIGKLGKQSKNESIQTYAYYYQGKCLEFAKEPAKALEVYMKAKDVAERKIDNWALSTIYNRIAYVHKGENNTPAAIKYFHTGIDKAIRCNDLENLSENYNALGIIYKDKSLIDSALHYHFKALEIRTKTGNKRSLANSLNNIGLVYKKAKDYPKALEYLERSMVIKKQTKDLKQLAGGYINIGNVHMYMKNYPVALQYLDSGIAIAGANEFNDFYVVGLRSKPECYGYMKRYEDAHKAWLFHERVKDSVSAIKDKKSLQELEMKYETVKKDSELKLKEEQLRSKSAQNEKQKLVLIASVIALLMALIAIFFVYRSFKQNKKNSLILSRKNHEIEEKNKEITDSINYAKLIQQSLLASKDMLDRNLESYFILYKPKDIVSGDFYWATETNKGFLIACVDCTGHGVPGAFMSLIGKENLDKAVSKSVNPGEILKELNINVKRSLNQNETSKSRDGMDAAIIRVEKDTSGNAELHYAGANRPLYILRKQTNSIEEIKATKQAIGGFTNTEQEYKEHCVSVSKGDTVVIATDGYADQFGSDKNKKLTTKRFKELLISVQSKSSHDQKNNLESFFNDWKGKNEQLDDLLVIGITI